MYFLFYLLKQTARTVSPVKQSQKFIIYSPAISFNFLKNRLNSFLSVRHMQSGNSIYIRTLKKRHAKS
jgi:hypothetical protein